MRALRLCTIVLSLSTVLVACGDKDTSSDDGSSDTDTTDGGDDSGEDTDTPDTQSMLMPSLLLVSAEHRDSAYLGYAVSYMDSQFYVGAPDDDLVGGFEVASDDNRVLDWVTDGADMSFAGLSGSYGGIGITPMVDASGNLLAAFVNGDYYSDAGYSNGGSLVGYRAEDISMGTSTTTDDAFAIMYGLAEDGYLGDTSIAGPDFDGDTVADLITGGGEPGVLYIISDILSVSGGDTADTGLNDETTTWNLPGDEDTQLTMCDWDQDGSTDATAFCGANKLVLNQAGDAESLFIFDSYSTYGGGTGHWEVYSTPLTSSSTPDWSDQGSGASVPIGATSTYIENLGIVLFNNPGQDEFLGYYADGSYWGNITMPSGAEAWGADYTTHNGSEYLALGAPLYTDPEDNVVGAVYIFDVSSGPPSDYEDAIHIAYGTLEKTGWSLAFGQTTDGDLAIAAGAIYPSSTGPTTEIGMEIFGVWSMEDTDTGGSAMTASNKPNITHPNDEECVGMDDPQVNDLLSRGIMPGTVWLSQ